MKDRDGYLGAFGMDFPSVPRLPLYSAEQVRKTDAEAIARLEGAGIMLMERAGSAAFQLIRSLRPDARTLSAIAGRGNNGGDAYIVARLALEAGWDVRLFPAEAQTLPRGDAAIARERYLAAGGEFLDFIPEDFEGAEILVDGLLGTGLDRPVEGIELGIIEAIHRYRARGLQHKVNRRTILSLDLPSGLHANHGTVLGHAVVADHTITFVQPKTGLFTGMGPAHAGTVHIADLSIDADILDRASPSAILYGWIERAPARRSPAAHKGHFGHILVVGGAPGYSGAARMSGEAALRSGAGLVTIGTHPQHAPSLNLTRPELMVRGLNEAQDLDPLLDAATVIAIGPGLGQSEWGSALFRRALETPLPLVVDADALNLLAQNPERRGNWILTPHPGEAARLLGVSTQAILDDRLASAHELSNRFDATVILKGSGSIIAGENQMPWILALGNAGMASGGMGDVLTGIVAALLAQGLSLRDAAAFGAMLHAGAADDIARRQGERGLLAGDLLPDLQRLLNTPEQLQDPCWPRIPS